jgi:hypothetical protein
MEPGRESDSENDAERESGRGGPRDRESDGRAERTAEQRGVDREEAAIDPYRGGRGRRFALLVILT